MPTPPPLLAYIARAAVYIHLELGNPGQAIALFSEAVAIDPTAAGATEALRAMTAR